MTFSDQPGSIMPPNGPETFTSQDLPNFGTPTDLDLFQFSSAAEEFCSYEALQEKYSALELSIATLQDRNHHLLKVLKYVDKGMSVKLAELDQLKKDNHYLRVYSWGN